MSLILLVVDSLRHDVLGCCGGEARTPVIDELAGSGVLFDRTVSAAPWTVPSLGSMMTGVYAHRLGLAKWEQPWPGEYPSLFAAAKMSGYEVGSFVFDPAHLFRRVPEASVVGSSQDLQAMFDWLAARRGKRFFAFIHYWWTHVPYIDKPMSVRAWRVATDRVLDAMRSGPAALEGARRLYQRAVERLSESFLPRLLEMTDTDSTWLAITADHGEGFGGRPETAALADVFDLHGNTLHDEVLRVPLLIRPPGGGPRRRTADLIRTVDIAPTLEQLCGFSGRPKDAGSRIDGISLAPYVLGEGPVPVLDAVSVRNRDFVDLPDLPSDPQDLWNGFALTTRRFKQIWYPREERRVAYDLETDPGETTDVRSIFEAELEGGWARLERERGRSRVGEVHPDDVERVRARLKRLGYLD